MRETRQSAFYIHRHESTFKFFSFFDQTSIDSHGHLQFFYLPILELEESRVGNSEDS